MIRSWLQKFMTGRYGYDKLFVGLYAVSMALWVLSFIPFLSWMRFLGYAIIFYALFRLMSRNIEKRRKENEKFLTLWTSLRRSIAFQSEKFRSRKEYRFFKCPSCANNLRVPKGKGTIRITCPKCGERFTKKT